MEMQRIVASDAPQRARAAASGRAWLALIAAAPILFALATWNPTGAWRTWQEAVRFFSAPVLAIECAILFAAIRTGASPLQALARQPLWVRGALAMLAAIAFGTAFFAPHPQLALMRTVISLLHLGFGLALASLLAERWRSAAPALWPLIVGGTCALLVLLGVYVAAIPPGSGFDWEGFNLAASNVRQLGFYSAAGGAAAIGLAAGARTRRGWWLWAAAGAATIGLSCWSGTRSSLVALAAALALGFALLPALRSRAAAGAVLVGFVGGAVLSLLHQPPSERFGLWRMSEQTELGSAGGGVASGRLDMWIGTLETALTRPFFGFGAGQFRFAVEESGGRYNHPHNFLLQLLIEWGFVGALLVLTLGGFLAWRFHRAARALGAQALPAWLAAASLAALSTVEGALYHPWPVMIVVAALAFLLAPAPSGEFRAPS